MGVRVRTGRGRGYGTAGADKERGPGAREVFGHLPKLVQVDARKAAGIEDVTASRAVQPLKAAKLAPGAIVAGGFRQRGDG